ncbi:MAG: F0F1 ATP synthase subunit delta [bacterium]|nr:F0F1 ATP synthase subunit delta [bacterium]
MKNKVKNYVTALAELILEAKPGTQKKITDGFFKLVLKHNYLSKASQIVALAEDIILRKKGNKKIILQTARKIEKPTFAKSFGAVKGDVIENEINPELIAGVKVIINNEKQLDFSLKNKLDQIF